MPYGFRIRIIKVTLRFEAGTLRAKKGGTRAESDWCNSVAAVERFLFRRLVKTYTSKRLARRWDETGIIVSGCHGHQALDSVHASRVVIRTTLQNDNSRNKQKTNSNNNSNPRQKAATKQCLHHRWWKLSDSNGGFLFVNPNTTMSSVLIG